MQKRLLILLCILVGTALISAREPSTMLQQQNGVTVCVEEITLSRVINEPGWLEKRFGAEWKHQLASGELDVFLQLPLRLLTVKVSILGDVENSSTVTAVFPKPNAKRIAIKVFGREFWQNQLPDIKVSESKRGIVTTFMLNESAKLADTFPIDLKVKVTTKDGEPLSFDFSSLEF